MADIPAAPLPPGSSDDTFTATIASPLPYLFAEQRHADRQAREALFCSFNADLGFFERTVLGVTQAAGARATVIGDARVSDPDPRATRNAGTRYVHGLAVTASGAAFHPKAVVVAGPERAVVAVGSGNLSTGGWHLNKETWTVCTADTQRCPVLIKQFAEWLRTLDCLCTITPQAVRGIKSTATLLEDLVNVNTLVETRHELIHTSATRLLDQLPDGHAERLLLYAPFHDERAEAIRSLISRFAPTRVTLAVQSDRRTVIQPDAIARMTEELGIQLDVIEDSSAEYRHGKLIEAVDHEGTRWALTGSANLSARALLHSAADGGNIELGIISRLRDSLFPEGSPIALSDVPAVRIGGSANRPATAVLIIAAIRSADGLNVRFAKPPSVPVRILSSVGTNFDSWTEIGQVPAGITEHLVADANVPGGTRIRGAWEANGGVHYGNMVFVTDPELVLNRPGENSSHGRATPPDPVDLITDPRLLGVWLAALDQLAAAPPSVTLPRVTGSGAPRGEKSTGHEDGGLKIDTDEERWLAYADDAQSQMGSAMFRFALGGFPALRAVPPAAGADLKEPTDRVIDERAPGLKGDDSEAVNEDVDPAADDQGPVNETEAGETAAADDDLDSSNDVELTEHETRRIRRLLERWLADTGNHSPIVSRLAVTQLLLCAIESGFWGTALGDHGWMLPLGKAIKMLNSPDMPGRLSSRVASLAAVGIYLMHEYRPTSERGADVLRYEEAARETAHLYADADSQLIADFAEPFTNRNGYPIDPDAVIHVVTMIVQDDPLAKAIDLLEERYPSWQIHRHDRSLLHISSSFRAPFLPAAEAIDEIIGIDSVTVWATGRSGDWAVAAREGGTLIRVDKQRHRTTWWHYRLNNLVSATRIARDPELANRVRIPHGPLNQAFAEAEKVLASVGFNPAAQPPCACPHTDS